MKPLLALALLLALLALLFSGCASSPFAQYDRTYSLQYISPDGQQLGGSMRLAPPSAHFGK